MNRKKKIIIAVIAVPLVTVIGFFAVFFGYSVWVSVELQKPHESTNVDELKYYSDFFNEVEMVGCEFTWKANVVMLGGVLESQLCGRVDLTDDYYNRITEQYTWIKSHEQGKDYSEIEGTEILEEFLKNNEWYRSREYEGQYGPLIYLSKNEKALYFYEYLW